MALLFLVAFNNKLECNLTLPKEKDAKKYMPIIRAF